MSMLTLLLTPLLRLVTLAMVPVAGSKLTSYTPLLMVVTLSCTGGGASALLVEMLYVLKPTGGRSAMKDTTWVALFVNSST